MKLLLDPSIDQSCICRVWPVSGVKSNVTFVVDITSLKHPDDVRIDCFGKWTHSGFHHFTFKATFEKDGDVFCRKVCPWCIRKCLLLAQTPLLSSNTDIWRMLAFVYIVCVCVCAHLHVQYVCQHDCMCILSSYGTNACVYMCVFIRVSQCYYVWCAHVSLCVHLCMCVHVCACVDLFPSCVCACISVIRVCTCICYL